MGATTYSLNGTAPLPIFPGGMQSPSIVKNVGLDSIWIGDAPNTSAINGFPLGPGSSLIWDKDRYLYALGTSTSSRLLTTFAIGNLFDAEAIAAQISVSGAPPVDNQNFILATSVVSAATRQTVQVNVAQYQSISVIIREHEPAPSAQPTCRKIQVAWGDETGGFFYLRDAETFYVTDDNNNLGGVDVGYCSYQTACKGPDLHIDVDPNGINGNVIDIFVVGSYKAMGSPRYVNRCAYWFSSGVRSAHGNAADGFASCVLNPQPSGTGTTIVPPHKDGACYLSWFVQGTAGQVFRITLSDTVSGGYFFDTGVIAVPGSTVMSGYQSLILPARPPVMGLLNGVGNTMVMHLSLTYDPL